MLTMFKKKIKEAVVAIAHPKSTEEMIEQIHNEFNGAGDILLKEANEILNGLQFCTKKADLLKKVGFRNAPEVVEVEKKVKKKELSENIAKAIQTYRLYYPNQKFITKEMVDQICKKYSLVCGSIGAYKGFVPLKNLKEIESFQIKEEHCEYNQCFRGRPERTATYAAYLKEKGTDVHYRLMFGIEKNDGLLICAPLKDMELSERQKVQGNWIIEIPDPVVLHPVAEGYLILTAWGDEASDPLVVNQIMN